MGLEEYNKFLMEPEIIYGISKENKEKYRKAGIDVEALENSVRINSINRYVRINNRKLEKGLLN